MSLFVSLFHIIVVGALFLYIGIKRAEIPKWLFTGLLVLGAFIVLYHAYKAVIKFQHKKIHWVQSEKIPWVQSEKIPWVNLIHILLIGPLLIYIGYNREDTERMYFEFMLMLGFAVIGYHGFYLVQDVFVKTL